MGIFYFIYTFNNKLMIANTQEARPHALWS